MQSLGAQRPWGPWAGAVSAPRIQVPDDLDRVEQRAFPLLGRKGQMHKGGSIPADSGTASGGDPHAPFFEPLKRAQIDQRAAELLLIDLGRQNPSWRRRTFRQSRRSAVASNTTSRARLKAGL